MCVCLREYILCVYIYYTLLTLQNYLQNNIITECVYVCVCKGNIRTCYAIDAYNMEDAFIERYACYGIDSIDKEQ